MEATVKEVLIVGGGASGILVATQLARNAKTSMAVHIADPAPILGRGIAYGTADDGHLLNVPAGRMSALPSDPTHFRAWAGCDDGEFISRKRYGQYLLETFLQSQKEQSHVSFTHERSRIERIERVGEGFEVTSESGPLGKFDAVVLATGHGFSQDPIRDQTILAAERYVNDPWRDTLPKLDGTLVSIGTGLTFIDLALTHLRRDPKNLVIGISRTGELPQAHLPVRAAPLPVPDQAWKSPTQLREYIDGSTDWRAAQDGIRHVMPEIWSRWNENQKRDFWTLHLRWWNVHRHRMSPTVNDELSALMESGRLQIVRASDYRLETTGEAITVSSGEFQTIVADVVVNSTGYLSFETTPLFSAMVSNGLVQRGPLGLGIRTNFPSHEVLGANGEPSPGLFAIGPLLVGERFETTAIPEIREQAERVALSLV
jgi:uncharacterized NAD(P)/FAD-binding protein YdhS